MSLLYFVVALAFLLASVQARATMGSNDSNIMIIGGTEAQPGQFPYQLQILYVTNFHHCGASLVQLFGTQVALTTANCVADMPLIYLNLRAGVLDWMDFTDDEQWSWPYHIVIHPDFDSSNLQNDIAIMFFNEQFQLNENVSAVSLPEMFEEVTPGTNVTISGWGTESQDSVDYQNVLHYVEIPVVSNEQCNSSWVSVDGTQILESQLCTRDVLGIAGPCVGDSGDPAVDEKGRLVGIVSWGQDNCKDTDTHPTVYTKVSHYVDWIERTVENYKTVNSEKNSK